MRFEWDENKNRSNLLRNDVRFETAVLVFDDPYALTQRDESSDEEERWNTLGAIAPGALLFVVHTWRESNGEDVIRIISARPAASHERREYEKANQGAKAGHRRRRREERRRH
ncbi:MAG: BrnT family toxin [Terriglobales bacterium]